MQIINSNTWNHLIVCQQYMLYSHMPYHNDTIIKTQEDFFMNICTSHFIVRVRKVLLKVCVWEGAGDRTETAIFWPPLLWPSALCLSRSPGLLNRRPSGPALCWMMAFFTASYQQLLWSPNSIGVPEGPFGRVLLSLPHLVYNSVRSLTVSNCNSLGAPRAPSAWCGFPYHISSITPSDL